MIGKARAAGFNTWADVRTVGLLLWLVFRHGYEPRLHALACTVYRYGAGDSFKVLANWREDLNSRTPDGGAFLYYGREKFARAIADRLNMMGGNEQRF